MLVYEIYCRDEIGRDVLIGILKERRKDPRRITKESILNWGRKAVDGKTDAGDIYFYISETDET